MTRFKLKMKKHILILWLSILSVPTINAQDDVTVFNESEVNSSFQEYSPAFFRDGLVFIASNPSVNLDKKEDTETGKSTTSIFLSKRDGDGKLMKPAIFAQELTTKFYDGPLVFGEEGNRIFFTRSNLKRNKPVKAKDGLVKLKIYTAVLQGETWTNIEELPFNSSEFDCTHPSVSADGKRLYFASNRPGGFGGLDLYVSTNINGKWSDAVNLGPKVNTAKNEVFPFIHSDGKVYFSTDGRKGIGNMDIYFTMKTDTGWIAPRMLPEPINSGSDDFGIIVEKDKKAGYFSSNRSSSKGDDDIFSFVAVRGVDAEPIVEEDESAEIVAQTEQPKDTQEGHIVMVSNAEIPFYPFNALPLRKLDLIKFNKPLYYCDFSKINDNTSAGNMPQQEVPTAEKQETQIKVEPISAIANAKTQNDEIKPTPAFDTEGVKQEVSANDVKPTTIIEEKPKEIIKEEAKTEVFEEKKPVEPIVEAVAPVSKTEVFEEKKPVEPIVEAVAPVSKTEEKVTIAKENTPIDTVITTIATTEKITEKPAEIVKVENVKVPSKVVNTVAMSNNTAAIKHKYLVVIGTYSSRENAVDQQRKALRNGVSETEIIQYKDNRLFAVCAMQTDDEKSAQALARTIVSVNRMDAFVKVLK
jgi:hypothetical protein